MGFLRMILPGLLMALPHSALADAEAFFGVKFVLEAETDSGAEVVASVRVIDQNYFQPIGDSDGEIETQRIDTPSGSSVFLKQRARLVSGAFVGEAMATPVGLANVGIFSDSRITLKNWGGATATVALTLEAGGDLASKVDGSDPMDRGNGYGTFKLSNRTNGVDIFHDRSDAISTPGKPEAKVQVAISQRHLIRLRPGQEVVFDLATTHFAIANSGDADALLDEDEG